MLVHHECHRRWYVVFCIRKALITSSDPLLFLNFSCMVHACFHGCHHGKATKIGEAAAGLHDPNMHAFLQVCMIRHDRSMHVSSLMILHESSVQSSCMNQDCMHSSGMVKVIGEGSLRAPESTRMHVAWSLCSPDGSPHELPGPGEDERP